MKKFFKITIKVLFVVLILMVIFVIGMTVIHKIKTSKEKSELADNGYINTVTVNGKDLNSDLRTVIINIIEYIP